MSLSQENRRLLEQAHNRRRALTGVGTAAVVALLVGGSVPGVAAEAVAPGVAGFEAPVGYAYGGAAGPIPLVPQYGMVPSAAGKDGLLLPGQALPVPDTFPTFPTSPTSPLSDLGIPAVALDAYRNAAASMTVADSSCGIDWSLIAGIGRVESDHGQYGGRLPVTDGTVSPPILGIALDGRPGVALILDTDRGTLDSDTVYDRAVGPMQFIPGTWASFPDADGDGNGSADPHNLYDAALATASYLCSGPGDLTTDTDQRTAVFRYNQSDAYVEAVLAYAGAYASGVTPTGPEPTPSGDTPVVPIDPIQSPAHPTGPGYTPAPGSPTAPPTTPGSPTAGPSTGPTGSPTTAPTTGGPTTTAPSTTAPPTTGPPTTGPPTTEPPTTEPPTTEPPTTEPPTTEPPTTEPGATESSEPATPTEESPTEESPSGTPGSPTPSPGSPTGSGAGGTSGAADVDSPTASATPRP